MLNAQIARARIADRNRRAERVAIDNQLLASIQPDKKSHRHRGRDRRIWNGAPERAPIQA